MALRKNYSTEIKDLEAVKQVAAELGYIQTRGRHRGQGSIRRLLEAIAEGEVYVVPAQEEGDEVDPDEAAIQEMARAGLVELGDPNYVFPIITPFKIDGPPLSEQIIADRR
jgi:hypothetical protein